MSEPTFTPGPWNVAGFDSRINEERYFGIDTPRGQMIVESFGECDFNRKANAALIAAAPDGYEYAETTAEVLRLLLETYKLPEQARKCLQERIDESEKYRKTARGEG